MRLRAKIGFIFIFSLLLFSCEAGSQINGRVIDKNGNPIKDAEVQFYINDRDSKSSMKTDLLGNFNRGLMHSPSNVEIKILISKIGYKTLEQKFRASELYKKKKANEIIEFVLDQEN